MVYSPMVLSSLCPLRLCGDFFGPWTLDFGPYSLPAPQAKRCRTPATVPIFTHPKAARLRFSFAIFGPVVYNSCWGVLFFVAAGDLIQADIVIS